MSFASSVGEIGQADIDHVGEVTARGLLGVEALGCVLRADVAFEIDAEERVALLEQCDVIGTEIAAHGVDEDELALLARAVLDALLALGGGKFGEVGVEFFGRGRLRLDSRSEQQQHGERRHPIPGQRLIQSPPSTARAARTCDQLQGGVGHDGGRLLRNVMPNHRDHALLIGPGEMSCLIRRPRRPR